MLCGHLDGDVSALADQLLVQAGSAAVVPPVPAPASQVLSDQPTDELAASG